ncbi:hypothetical protein LOK49_LG10G02589 [Camellia lanceoleosa]|uniref:Uncharacterized protein n=1 Tax=Camellia lanceoleosa TaxID=1840588 RepID=A0ACC0GF20_9ERIC|nr:hypothetical protein LOK49_LG10G02589 [Camellia lanceoleosa]
MLELFQWWPPTTKKTTTDHRLPSTTPIPPVSLKISAATHQEPTDSWVTTEAREIHTSFGATGRRVKNGSAHSSHSRQTSFEVSSCKVVAK